MVLPMEFERNIMGRFRSAEVLAAAARADATRSAHVPVVVPANACGEADPEVQEAAGGHHGREAQPSLFLAKARFGDTPTAGVVRAACPECSLHEEKCSIH